MITFPVPAWATRAVAFPQPSITVWPPSKIKSLRAAKELFLRLGRRDIGCHVAIQSAVPEGHGFASSSADIVATCQAIGNLLDVSIPAEEVAAIACGIEASDAVMYDHPVAFNFVSGRLLADPGRALPVRAVAVDIGSPVDTVSFTRVPYTAAERGTLRHAYDAALDGLRQSNLPTVAQAATVSARINQRRLPKPHLEELVKICSANGGHGVSVAHSGTVSAMLFDERNTGGTRRAAWQANHAFPQAVIRLLSTVDASQENG